MKQRDNNTTKMENEKENEQFERYNPQHPLPKELQKMERDETVCKYCGVSYLIHNEIKALEELLKKTKDELQHYKGMEERENKLKEELKQVKGEKDTLQSDLTIKESVISTMRNNLKNEEENVTRLQKEKTELQKKLEETETLKEEFKTKFILFETNMPGIKSEITDQRTSISEIHKAVTDRDKQIKQELDSVISSIMESCHRQDLERKSLQQKLSEIETTSSESQLTAVAMTEKVKTQQQELNKLTFIKDENLKLQQQCAELQDSLTDVKKELEEMVSKNRSIGMEIQQFKDQLKSKNQEIEELTSQSRRKEQNSELMLQKIQSELRQKEAELQSSVKDMKNLENKFHEQKRKEEEIHRKATFTVTESRELKDQLKKYKDEVEHLKSEREVMITSHQNRIEQLRDSFRNKIFEAEKWPEKLEEAMKEEKAKHEAALRELEDRLKQNFIMEMQIEKQKYQELLEKHKNSTKDHESMLKSQLNQLETKYRSEIRDLQQIITNTKERAKETENSLKKEVESLKAIIHDLENRLARLDSGNEEMITKLKSQLKETNHELEENKEELQNKQKELETIKAEVVFLQETVRKECEERFELTEALSDAKAELLRIRKPSGGYSSGSMRQSTAGSNISGGNIRQSSSISNASSLKSVDSNHNSRTQVTQSKSEESLNRRFSDGSGMNGSLPPPGPLREYTTTVSRDIPFPGENVKTVGNNNKLKGGTLAENRRRIAAMLGRKS